MTITKRVDFKCFHHTKVCELMGILAGFDFSQVDKYQNIIYTFFICQLYLNKAGDILK